MTDEMDSSSVREGIVREDACAAYLEFELILVVCWRM